MSPGAWLPISIPASPNSSRTIDSASVERMGSGIGINRSSNDLPGLCVSIARESHERRGRGKGAQLIATHAPEETNGVIKDLWYKNAVVYCVHVGAYMDSNGDGCGDF